MHPSAEQSTAENTLPPFPHTSFSVPPLATKHKHTLSEKPYICCSARNCAASSASAAARAPASWRSNACAASWESSSSNGTRAPHAPHTTRPSSCCEAPCCGVPCDAAASACASSKSLRSCCCCCWRCCGGVAAAAAVANAVASAPPPPRFRPGWLPPVVAIMHASTCACASAPASTNAEQKGHSTRPPLSAQSIATKVAGGAAQRAQRAARRRRAPDSAAARSLVYEMLRLLSWIYGYRSSGCVGERRLWQGLLYAQGEPSVITLSSSSCGCLELQTLFKSSFTKGPTGTHSNKSESHTHFLHRTLVAGVTYHLSSENQPGWLLAVRVLLSLCTGVVSTTGSLPKRGGELGGPL